MRLFRHLHSGYHQHLKCRHGAKFRQYHFFEVIGGVAYTWRVVDNGRVGGQVARARAIREMNEISLRQLEANAPRTQPDPK